MKGRPLIKLSIPFLFLAFIAQMQVQTGCAVIVPPQGGPKDTLAPVLVSANPPDSTLNFHGNRITLTFNEFVDINDPPNNFIFTPTFQNNPVVSNKLKTVTIRIKDSLKPNTTYTFNFGNALRDVNEGNVYKNFTYIFSTGSHIDTIQYSGRVLLAQTGDVDSTLIVVLHRNRIDSAVAKERPEYYTRLNKDGSFRFRNLPPRDTFAIYAIGDAGFSRRYTSKTQLFAFSDTPIITGQSAPARLFAYREMPKVTPGTTSTTSNTSTGKAAPNEKARLRFTTNINNNEQDLLNDLILTFPVPLKSFDSSRISFSTDSSYQPARYSVTMDTTKKELRFKSVWKEATLYHLVLNKDFAQDTNGRQLLKPDTLSFTTRKLTDYGTLRLRIRNLDTSQHPVLLFIQNDQTVFSAPIKSGVFSSSMFLPGEYELRILYDKNGNGKWDPGQFYGKKKQPELVLPIKDKITVKAAWDNDFERSL